MGLKIAIVLQWRPDIHKFNRLRSTKKTGRRFVPADRTGNDPVWNSVQNQHRPDLNLSGLLDRIDLQSAIDVLPNGYKTAFLLHDVEGYEHREIAEMRGNSVGNSKSQLHKARLKLRKLLGAIPSSRELKCRPSRPQVCASSSRCAERTESPHSDAISNLQLVK